MSITREIGGNEIFYLIFDIGHWKRATPSKPNLHWESSPAMTNIKWKISNGKLLSPDFILHDRPLVIDDFPPAIGSAPDGRPPGHARPLKERVCKQVVIAGDLKTMKA